MNKNLKKGGFAAIFTVIVIAAVIVINLIAGTVPAKYRRLDLSTNQIFSLSDTTRELLGGLTKDVDIYIVGDPDRVDERITHFAGLYADLSQHVNVTVKDPVLHPDVLSSLGTEANTVLVSCPDTGKTQSIPFSDIIQIDMMAYYQYQQYKESAFDGEGQITSAISYVDNDNETGVYQLSGHKESTLPSMVTDALKKSNMQLRDLNLLTDGAIPEDCELLLVNNPQTDIAVDEKEMISDYLKQGGHVLILAGYTESGCPNLTALCADYGMELKNGYVADTAPGQFYNNNPFLFFPEYDFSSGMLDKITSRDPALLSNPSGMTISQDLRDGLTVSPFLTTTDSGIFVDPATQEQVRGTYVLGATATEPAQTGESSQAATASQAQAQDSGQTPEATLTVITAPSLIDGSLLQQFPSITNLTIFMNAASHNISQAVNLSIPAKSLDVTYNMITAGGLWSALFIIVIPVIFLIAGFVIWMKRRKL
ncbi:MAG: GldG family protein [Clostridium sp.]|nr:GldG family protein [Clostridium sp.]